MQCPKCNFENEIENLFCENCGIPISKSSQPIKNLTLENSVLVKDKTPLNTNLNSHPISFQSSSHSTSSKQKKWIAFGGFLFGIVFLLCGLFLIRDYSINSPEQEVDLSQKLIISSSPKRTLYITPSSSTSRKSISSMMNHFENLKENGAQNISITLTPQKLLSPHLNYSELVCALMTLSLYDHFPSPEELINVLAADLEKDNSGEISDYDLSLCIGHYPNVPYYHELDYYDRDMDYSHLGGSSKNYENFLIHIDETLEAGLPPIITIGKTPDNLLQHDSFVMVSGRNVENETYTLIVPYVDTVKTYEVNLQTLEDMIASFGSFQCLYL